MNAVNPWNPFSKEGIIRYLHIAAAWEEKDSERRSLPWKTTFNFKLDTVEIWEEKRFIEEDWNIERETKKKEEKVNLK